MTGTSSVPATNGPVIRFLIATTTSFYGDWFTTVGLVVLLYRLTGSPAAPAGYILARVAPRVLGPTPGGIFADRFSPTLVVCVCSILQALLTLSIIASAEAHLLWAIYTAVALAQLLGAMAKPCHAAIIPHLVKQSRFGRINGIYNGAFSTSMFVGPALGAPLLAFAGVVPLIIVDSLSFVVCAALMLTLPVPHRVKPVVRQAIEPASGLRVLWRDPILRAFAGTFAANAAVITTMQAVLVVAAAERFGSDVAVGWLYAAVGVGGLVGSGVAIRWHPKHVRRTTLTAAGLLELSSLLLLTMTWSLWVAAGLLIASGFFGNLYETWGTTGLQHRVSRDLVARTNAGVFLLLYMGMLTGSLWALVMVPVLGWSQALVVLGLVALAVLCLLSLPGRSGKAARIPVGNVDDESGLVGRPTPFQAVAGVSAGDLADG